MPMDSTISLIGDEVIISLDQEGFYDIMLKAITDRVFQLLGPTFDKKAYLEEVEKGRIAAEIGKGWAVPVAMLLGLELGYCLGQLRSLDRHFDCDKALKDLYDIFKNRLKTLIEEEQIARGTMH